MKQKTAIRSSLDLSGVWKYKVDNDNIGIEKKYFEPAMDRNIWGEMDIPNNWYLTEIGDYFGTVWFQKEFNVPRDLEGKRLTLKFNAVDYFADVWLNGEYLGHHEGYFTPFEFDVTDIVRFDTKNILVVRDDAPRDPTEYFMIDDASNSSNPLSPEYRRHWAKELTLIKGHHIDAMHRPGAMTKFRQDGNSGGIWQKVELIATGDVKIQNTKIYCKIVENDGTALVSVDLTVDNKSDKMIATQAKMVIKPNNFDEELILVKDKAIQIQPGTNVIKFVQTIEKPKLWWTWDHGYPHLYEAEFTIGGSHAYDYSLERFGIKTVEHDEKTGNWILNGKKIFLRGMRYLSSLWISEMSEEKYKEDLDKMLDLNINSIRIGSHVELEEFYDLCDEMGLLVWQVFPMHYCYSDSDDLIEKATPMIKQMVMMLYNHASIGMWSVFKEPEVYGSPDKPNNYGRLCQIMYEAAKTVDPIRWVHIGDYREGVQNITIGQCYPWNTDIKRMRLEPNIVEFGCGALPCKQTLLEILPEEELWPPNWDQWEYYCFFYDIMFNVAKIDMGNSLDEFIDNSQIYAARSIKEQIEYCRQNKYRPVGSMYLYFWNDSWASIGGSGLLDYFRRPYKSYEAFKQVYTPVLISLEWNRDPYIIGKQKVYRKGETFIGNLWATNDKLENINDAKILWKLIHVESNKAIKQGSFIVDIPEDSARIIGNLNWEISKDSESGDYVVIMEISSKDGSKLSYNDFYFAVQ